MSIKIDNLSRDELIILQGSVKAELKKFKPFRIKEVYKSCGVSGCYCEDGIDLHGPYLLASFRENGKTKTKSLGRKFYPHEIDELRRATFPNLRDYFTITPFEYEKLPTDEQNQLSRYDLTDRQFQDIHGVTKAEDNFGRPTCYYGLYERYEQYQVDYDLALQRTMIPDSPWAEYGVGTLRGLAVISQLESKNYYFKE